MGRITPENVHEALLRLYSPNKLARSALADLLPESAAVADAVQRAQLVRNALLDAAQTLRPANRLAPSATTARAHTSLMLRYVSGMAIGEIATELHLSSRQVYRDLRWAEAHMADLLSSRLSASAEAAPPNSDTLTAEIVSIAHKPEQLNLREVLRACLSAVEPIAQQRHVSLVFGEPKGNLLVSATPGIFRQAVIQLLSSIVQNLTGEQVQLDLVPGNASVSLRMRFPAAEQLVRPDLIDSALRVANSQGLSCSLRRSGRGASVHLELPLAARQKVLILEDSPGACALYERYLEGTEFEAWHVADPRAATALAAEQAPAAVILDIMMPEVDGWTVLQSLKLDSRTRSIPVVICSVIADPGLGTSLGAAHYLSKPVSRADLLICLRRILAERTPA